MTARLFDSADLNALSLVLDSLRDSGSFEDALDAVELMNTSDSRAFTYNEIVKLLREKEAFLDTTS